MHSENLDNDGGLGFDKSILVCFEINEGVEDNWFEMANEDAMNNCAQPMGWYFVNEGVIINRTSKKDISDLKENFKFLTDLYECLNKMKQ